MHSETQHRTPSLPLQVGVRAGLRLQLLNVPMHVITSMVRRAQFLGRWRTFACL